MDIYDRYQDVCERNRLLGETNTQLATSVRALTEDLEKYKGLLKEAKAEVERLKAAGDNPAGRIADLEWDRDLLREQLAAMTAARDEACEIAEAATFVIDNGLCERCRSSISNVDVERIDALRKVGQP